MAGVNKNASCDNCFYSEVCVTHIDEKNRNPVFPHNTCQKHLDRTVVERALKLTTSELDERGETIHQHLIGLPMSNFAKWVAETCGKCETPPWSEWFQHNYCEKCEPVMFFSSFFQRDVEESPCERGDCPFNVKDLPEEKVVEMWLEQLWEDKPNNE